jgi:hypothetical protein
MIKVCCISLGILAGSALGICLFAPNFLNEIGSTLAEFMPSQKTQIGAKPSSKSVKKTAKPAVTEPTEPLVNVAEIADKTPAEIEQVLGKPTQSATVNPSRTDCPCQELTYRSGLVEIIYMNGKADWITINLPKNKVNMDGSYLYSKTFRNPEYVFIKVATN